MKHLALIIILTCSALFAQNNYSTSSNWLLETNTSAEKFQAIQKQFRGFDMAMVEVGYRFSGFYFALKDKNYDLAHYQWDKIKKAIENGITRRPARANNAKAMFLESQYQKMKDALNTKNKNIIWQEYKQSKLTCNACHKAENVAFIKVVNPRYQYQPIK